MDDSFILKKEKVERFLSELSEKYDVYTPVKRDDYYKFSSQDGTKRIEDVRLTEIPPKSVMFPQTETLFKFKRYGGKEVKDVEKEERGKAIVGIRPCDAKSFFILDEVFKNDYDDPYYLNRRKDSLVVGVGCLEPGASCFCTLVEGGPFETTGLDILLSDLEDRFYVEPVSEEGRDVIESNHGLFSSASQEDKEERERREEEALKKIERGIEKGINREVEIDRVVEGLEDIFEDDYWEEVAAKCMGCGICTYLCPTCHCFDIQDEVSDKEGERVRVWDSCMFPEYTLHASGYNPRPGRMNRLRNRVYHKYDYMPNNFDLIGCVGCGRCIDNCPANVDILEVVAGAEEVMEG